MKRKRICFPWQHIYNMNSSTLLAKNMLCSKLHCQTGFNSTFSVYKTLLSREQDYEGACHRYMEALDMVKGRQTQVQGSGFGVQGSEFRVQGSRFGVQGSEFRVQGSRFRVSFLRSQVAKSQVVNPMTACPKVDTLGLWHQSVNFGARKAFSGCPPARLLTNLRRLCNQSFPAESTLEATQGQILI